MKTPPHLSILSACCAVAKSSRPEKPACPECGERVSIWAHGSYWRYAPGSSSQVLIPRFRCLHARCPRQTFSILPFPFLRYVRHSLCLLVLVSFLIVSQQVSLRGLAQKLDLSRRTLQRAVARGHQVSHWLQQEGLASRWGPWPCHQPSQTWTDFTQAFSHRFYPYPTHFFQPT